MVTIFKLLRLGQIIGWAALVLGVFLQFGLKDRIPGISLLFYAMPKPCLAALAITLAIWPRVRWRSRMAAALAAVTLAGLWISTSWHQPKPVATTPRNPDQEVRILYWNLCRPTGVQEAMVKLVQEFQPHVAAFVEPGQGDMEARCKTYESLLPGYQAAWMPRGILWLSKVPSRYRARGKLEGIGAFARFDVDGLGPTFPVVVGDVYPNPFHSRKGQLAEILEHAQGRSDAIMLGDFNTPLESVFFEPFRQNYTQALEQAGQGFQETWPLGFPLLSLDHLWLGHDWQVVETRKLWSVPDSDHAALLVTLTRSAQK